VATTLQRLLDAGLGDPPHLPVALLGGGPAPAPLLERAAAAGVRVAQTYGMTETCSQAATSLPGEAETAGRPLAGARIAISDDGEILVAGPTVAPGALGPDGWVHTGDLGRLDDRGRLTVIGRKADTIVSGGENVAPAEVEAVLLAHPDVVDAAVYGRPDPQWGEAVVARLVLRDGAVLDLDAVRAFCAGRLASFKAPKAVEIADSLPRTASGKLMRRAIRADH
jgi:o-succinylbenzoate---CoA ligase